jgi:thymidylate synthase (FAD)
MTLQIETTRGIAAQILRHRSFTFQEFSQRYADSMQLGEIPIPELRRQDNKNRQNSISDLPKEIINTFNKKIKHQFVQNKELYEEMLEAGIAKECARFVLPLATPTRIYMTGSCRSWIHYINLRTGHGTQKEHMEIAQECKNIFSKEYPVVSSALNWLV